MKTLTRKLPPSTLKVIHEITGEEVMPASRLAQHLIGLIYAVDPTIWARRVDLCLVGGDPLLLARRLSRIAAECDFRARIRVAVVEESSFSGAPLAALGDAEILSEMVRSGEVPTLPSGQSRDANSIVRSMIAREAARIVSSGLEVLWVRGAAQAARDHERGEIVLRLCASPARPDFLRAAEGSAQDLFADSAVLAKLGHSALRTALSPVLREAPVGSRFADILIAARLEVLSGFVSPGRHPEVVRFDSGFMEEIGGEVFRLARRVPTSVEDAISDWRADLRRAAGHLAV